MTWLHSRLSALVPLAFGFAVAMAAGSGCLDATQPSTGTVDGGGLDAGAGDGAASDGTAADLPGADGGQLDTADGGGDPCQDVTCPPAMGCPPGSSSVVLPGECCGSCVADGCTDDADCTECLYPTAPESVDECYCAECTETPLSVERCAYNEAVWRSLCEDVPLSCPAVACGAPLPAVCVQDEAPPAFAQDGLGICTAQLPDPCANVDCAALECTNGHPEVPPGECCPVCVPDTCEADGDCAMCAFPTAPASADDCYCPLCPDDPMTAAQCEFNTSAWKTVCADVPIMCPDVACQEPPPAVCLGDAPEEPKQCVEGVVDPCGDVDCAAPPCPPEQQVIPPGACCPVCEEPLPPTVECLDDSDCTLCTAEFAPTSTDECQCPTCGTYTSVAQCAANTAAYATFCGSDVWPERASCMPPPCPAPPPAGCNQGYVCGPDECAMVMCEPPDCPLAEQVTPPGACCPVCAPPAQCADGADCTWCLHATAPTSVADCACPMCPTAPMTAAQCAANTAAFDYYCNSQTWPEIDACQPPPCMPPEPLTCDSAGQCVPQPDATP